MIDNRHERRSAARNPGAGAKALQRMPYSRVAVLVLALLALTIQMLAVQSHVHRPLAAEYVLSDGLTGHIAGAGSGHSSPVQHHKYPDDQDPSKCPFCQQLGHSGQFVASTVVLISIRCCVSVVFIAFSESARALCAVRHSWQSRAPPQK
jgi:hypothetical protein